MNPYLNKLARLLRSRKFWAAIAGLIVAIFGARAGIDAQAITQAICAIVAYILGTALEDGLARRAQ